MMLARTLRGLGSEGASEVDGEENDLLIFARLSISLSFLYTTLDTVELKSVLLCIQGASTPVFLQRP
jgi:hypothetical protein